MSGLVYRVGLSALLLLSVGFSVTFLYNASSSSNFAINAGIRGFAARSRLTVPLIVLQSYLQAALGGGTLYPANPWRSALARGRIDWHDLVAIDSPPKTMETNLATLRRHMRDDAKDDLLILLQNAGARARTPASRPAGGWAQERLVAALRRSNTSASVYELLSQPGSVATAALDAGVDVDDISEHRRGADDGAPLRGCNVVRDKCLLHASLRACIKDAFCGWCAARSICLTRNAGYLECAPQSGVQHTSAAAEKILVNGEPLISASGLLVVDAATLVTAKDSRHGVNGLKNNNCSLVVRDNLMTVEIQGNSKMAYHWATETLPVWMADARKAPQGLSSVDNVVVIKGEWNDLLSWASVFTHSCARAINSQEVQRACFSKQPSSRSKTADLAIVDARTGQLLSHISAQDASNIIEPLGVALRSGMQLSSSESLEALDSISSGGEGASQWLASLGDGAPSAKDLQAAAAAVATRLRAIAPEDFGSVTFRECGAWWELPPLLNAPPVVVIVSRLNKRLILNEPDLVRAAIAMGAEVYVAALEAMSVCAQVRLFQRASVVVGVHGSALINSLFMRRGSALLQIVPFMVQGAGTFFEGPALSRGVRYREIFVDKRTATIPHDHFLKPNVSAEDLFNDVRKGKVIPKDTWFSFLINQDTTVDIRQFVNALDDLLPGGPRTI